MKEIRKLDIKKLTNIVKTVKGSLLKEDEDRFSGYRTKVEFDIESNNRFEGKDIDEIRHPEHIDVIFDLYIYERKWGIESIGVVNIRGPKEIEIEFDVYNEEIDDYDTFYHTIKLNWEEKNLELDTSNAYSENVNVDLQTTLRKILLILDEGFFQEKIIFYPFED
jgi:hypothetical protein